MDSNTTTIKKGEESTKAAPSIIHGNDASIEVAAANANGNNGLRRSDRATTARNKNPNAADSTALVKATNVNKEKSKKSIADEIARHKCSSPGCGKNYVLSLVYTTDEPSGTGFCTPCFNKVLNALPKKEKDVHEELKYRRMLELANKASKKNWKNDATLDEHIYRFAKDPELPSFHVTDDGLLTITDGSFPLLLKMLETQEFSIPNEQVLMDLLRCDYGAVPDKLICCPGRGPDDEGRTYLKPGWKDKNVLLWFEQYDLEEHGGVPKFGFCEETKRMKKKTQAKKRAAKKEAKAKKAEAKTYPAAPKKETKKKVASKRLPAAPKQTVCSGKENMPVSERKPEAANQKHQSKKRKATNKRIQPDITKNSRRSSRQHDLKCMEMTEEQDAEVEYSPPSSDSDSDNEY